VAAFSTHVPKSQQISEVDQAVFAALDYDIPRVLTCASKIDPWLACHLTDFLHYCGQLEMPTEKYERSFYYFSK